MIARMLQQSRGKCFPRFKFESKNAKKFRLVPPIAVRG